MELSLLYLFFFFLTIFDPLKLTYSSSTTQPQCHESESSALLQFKAGVLIDESASKHNSAYPKVRSWKKASDCCSWDGVECDEKNGHVVSLNLSSSFLYGSLNSTNILFTLLHLQKLSLSDNYFNYSQIPRGIGNLTKLTHLDLSYSVFAGQIPSEISQLTHLSFLDLSSYSGGVELPSLLSLVRNLTKLQVLGLHGVDISSTIPNILANLTSLISLDLSYCGLGGSFPTEIFHLPNLERLDLSSNHDLNGYFPEFHSNHALKSLTIIGTSFSGELPATIGNLYLVNDLRLGGNSFTGPVPSSIGNLTLLTYLDLSYNQLVGYFPFPLGNLTQLTSLYLSWNSFSDGTLSWIGKLIKLNYLFLDDTNINGPIPHSLINVTQLIYLDLSNNKLQGPLPTIFSELRSLEFLLLDRNNLSGTFEIDVFLELKNLSVLYLSNNNFTLLIKRNINITGNLSELGLGSCNLQEFPNFLEKQNELSILDLSHNNISGKIGTWMWSTTKNLQFLDLSHNILTGFVQHPLFLPSGLTFFDVSFNSLQGSIPLPSADTEFFIVSNNKLSGQISPLICNSSSLSILDLSNNNLSGFIPQCLGNLRRTIPQSWINTCKLTMIDLSQNQLQGQLPRSLANCTMLEFLHIGNNHINDVFPSWLGPLPRLRVLILRSNEFHSIIGKPKTNSVFPQLHVVDLSDNNFSASLPSKYFLNWDAMKVVDAAPLEYMFEYSYDSHHMSPNEYYFALKINNKGMKMDYWKISDKLTLIDLSSNKFEGEIPESIASLKGLRYLNLSNNMINGHIPSSLVNLQVLESLDLSRNNLSGEIPQQLAQLNFLAFFNVSDNDLNGVIPRGKQFNTLENNSFEGNVGLCGDPLSRKCGNSGVSPPPSSSTFESDKDSSFSIEFDWKIVVIGYGSGVIVGVVIGNSLYTRIYERLRHIFGWKKQKRRIVNRRRGTDLFWVGVGAGVAALMQE